MEKVLIEYKKLKRQLVGEIGCEESTDQVMWNDGIMDSMEELLVGVPTDIAKMIRLNHL